MVYVTSALIQLANQPKISQ